MTWSDHPPWSDEVTWSDHPPWSDEVTWSDDGKEIIYYIAGKFFIP
jgi:hypothetical protein